MTGWKRTHCTNGHEWTPENTMVDSLGKRRCRACRRASELRNVEARRPAKRARSARPEVRERRAQRDRERYLTDAEYRARGDTRTRARLKGRYAKDPEFREHKKAATRAYCASHPEVLERAKALARARYANDPEYRGRVKTEIGFEDFSAFTSVVITALREALLHVANAVENPDDSCIEVLGSHEADRTASAAVKRTAKESWMSSNDDLNAPKGGVAR